METDTLNWQPEYEYHCATCGIDINDGVDVIDTETMTAHVVCNDACIDEHMIEIPAHAFETEVEPDIPEWAYTNPQPKPQPVAMVDEAKVIQIRAPWDAPTDLLMYEFNDGEEGVDA